MLKILHKHRKDRDLCLFAAKTILRVVSNHHIEFDYQEMTIIKKFNLALEHIDTDPNLEIDDLTDSEEQWEEIDRQKQESVASEVIDNEEIKEHLKVHLDTILSPTTKANLEQVEGGSVKLNIPDEPILSPNSLVKFPSSIVDAEKEQALKQKQMGHFRPSLPSNTEGNPESQVV
jgi:hypothetical protein